MSKFKIGQEIFFVENNLPKKSEIKGIAIYEGKCEAYNFTKEAESGKTLIVYHTGGYSSVEEKNAYSSKEELIESFSKELK